MSSIEDKYQAASNALHIPGAVLVATDKAGDFDYQKAFGPSSLKDPSSARLLKPDSVFWIASCTKLMTTIAAMQCVERGQFGLDDDVSTILPELKDIEILSGFEEDTQKPILKKAENKITLRQLLTHSSGLGYDIFNPTLLKWRTLRGEPVSLSGLPILDRLTTPLVFEPGTSWEYGTGIDWAGQMVARANKTDLQSYMQKNMWEPLGITGITFHLETREDMTARKMEMSFRVGDINPMFGTTLSPDGALVWTDKSPFPSTLPAGEEYGGAGGWASPAEYIKILHSILANDGKLLKPATVDEMFKPQLGDGSREAFMQRLTFPEVNRMMGGFPDGMKVTWGIGGLLILEDMPTGRKKGSMSWGGLPNLIWWVDPEGGLAGLSATQVIPPGDPKCCDMHSQWEKAMYEKVKGGSRL